MIEAAKRIAPAIDFRVGDAEALDFKAAEFDAATSTFGVMFVARPEAAAAELARVIRHGGRLALATWRPRVNGNQTAFAPIHSDQASHPSTAVRPFEGPNAGPLHLGSSAEAPPHERHSRCHPPHDEAL